MLFDSSCVSTLQTAGYKVDGYVVDDSNVEASVLDALCNSSSIQQKQRTDWYKNYDAIFAKEFARVMKKIGVSVP
jgi:hypothetical protein